MLNLFKRCLSAEYTHTEAGTDYAVKVEGDTIYLLFECSDDKEDWRSNFNFPCRAYKNGGKTWFAHRGFLKAWKDVRDEIEMQVSEILAVYGSQIGKICVVGYSHGAALALLCTEDMAYLYGDALVVGGYGFGCPRVVWGFLPKAVKTRLKAFKVIRNVPDLVTRLPPVLFGFRHPYEVIKIGRRRGIFRFIPKYRPIKAHYPGSYSAELAESEVHSE